MARFFMALACAVSIAMVLPVHASDVDRIVLLDGVKEIAAPGWTGDVIAYGPEAFCVVAGGGKGSQSCAVAASRLGQGRLFVMGHDGYLWRDSISIADTGRLIKNAVTWLRNKPAPRVVTYKLPEMAAFLKEQGFTVTSADGADWTAILADCDVLIAHGAQLTGSADVVRAFVEAGGGFLTADTGWGWEQITGKQLEQEHPALNVLAPAGIMFADGGLDRTSAQGFETDGVVSSYIQASTALDAIEAYAGGATLEKDDLSQVSFSVTHVARSVPANDPFILPRLKKFEVKYATEALPAPDKPLKLDNPMARLALTLQMAEIMSAPAASVKTHPAAEFFPGSVPADAPRIERTVTLDTEIPLWHSTGLYAAPGELIEIIVPDEAASKGLRVRIGCHTDGIWHLNYWQRAPEITRSFDINTPVTEAANAFGGTVYIEVPEKFAPGNLQVTIRNAVAAPYFKLGKTDLETWKTIERNNPGPWAELESDGLILSVPSEVVRQLDDPVQLMEFWDHIADSCDELVGKQRGKYNADRYVADTQISAGYMHSGYPIMTFLDVKNFVVDVDRLMKEGSWGHFHEIGHNHQWGEWTFDGTGEVTENLFSVYLLEKVCGLSGGQGHPAIAPEERAKVTAAYLAAPDFNKWKSNPFLALYMYLQLKENFGWQAYKHVFKAYQDMPESERPQTDDAKRDVWMVTFSREIGRNLGPFFECWGVPTSQAARDSIADLPVWLPVEMQQLGNTVPLNREKL